MGHLVRLSLLKIRLHNHVNTEQVMALKVENVYEVSSFLLRMMDPGKMISKYI